ncbi:PE family protein [Mycobacterium nebraskense]|jgi:hypothetical protein|uniref:PE family protein n=1 Tax=Mycobacterium nebraskense TaxID=244292 RepID=A0A1X1YYW8_9MYCO|nr:PE family protein [Mycobacterium nebraskense]MCV7117757.1 PE family protein [Mycobacterium nebraskense]ORW16161.1 PE family protein [Mycobacterium nebraskense]
MSFVTTMPDILASATSNLAGIGSAISAADAAAATPTIAVIAAATDEVSAQTAIQFAAHASLLSPVSTQPAAIHDQFVGAMGASAGSYAATKAANATAAS